MAQPTIMYWAMRDVYEKKHKYTTHKISVRQKIGSKVDLSFLPDFEKEKGSIRFVLYEGDNQKAFDTEEEARDWLIEDLDTKEAVIKKIKERLQPKKVLKCKSFDQEPASQKTFDIPSNNNTKYCNECTQKQKGLLQ